MDIVLSLGWAFGLGALHALEPGHGKGILGAYIVGTRGRFRDLLVLAAVLTGTHTGLVLVLGLLAVTTAVVFLPEQIQAVLQIVSGVLVVGVGVWTLLFRTAASTNTNHQHSHAPDSLADAHAHRPGRSGLVAVGISGGLVPCPGALAVLAASVGRGRIAEGVGMVLAFGIGMALMLVLVGLVLLRAAGILSKRLEKTRYGARALTTATGLAILGMGIVLLANAFGGHYH